MIRRSILSAAFRAITGCGALLAALTSSLGGAALAVEAQRAPPATETPRYSDDGLRCLDPEFAMSIRYETRPQGRWTPQKITLSECGLVGAALGGPVEPLRRCDTAQYACIETGWALPVAVPKSASSPLAVVNQDVEVEPLGVTIRFLGADKHGCLRFHTKDRRHTYFVQAQSYTYCRGIGVTEVRPFQFDGVPMGTAYLATARGLLSGW